MIPPPEEKPQQPASWREVAVFAAGYFVLGWLALWMAIPPGYATAVWPAAGFALAAVLRRGGRAAFGIAAGSFLVNLGSGSAPFGRTTILVAASIACGAALQAIVAAHLIRRRLRAGDALVEETDILRFTVLAGPIASTVNATVGVIAVTSAQLSAPAEASYSWFTWWVGDSIGVLLFAPLSLMFLGTAPPVWTRRRGIVGGPLLVGFFLVTALFLRVSRWEALRLQRDFDDRAAALGRELQSHLEADETMVRSVARFIEASEEVRRDEFAHFARLAAESRHGIIGLGWTPVVSELARTAFEEVMRAELNDPSFQIWERDPDRRRIPAKPRKEHVVIQHLVSLVPMPEILGFDVSSEPTRVLALELARRTGGTVCTAPIELVQRPASEGGLLLYHPATRPSAGAPAERLRGFACGIFDVEHLVESALESFDRTGLILRLRDETEPGRSHRLVDTATEVAGVGVPATGPAAWSTKLDFGTRTWSLTVAPDPRIPPVRSWQPWMVLGGGLFSVSLLGIILLMATGRTDRFQRAIDELEAEMREKNELARERDAQRTMTIELEAARLAADAASEAKSAFLATMSHEIRTPMNSILGMAELLQDSSLDANQREYLQVLRRSGDVLLSLINDVLDISRIESGQVEIRPRPFDIVEVAEGVVESVAVSAHRKGLEIVCRPDPGIPRDLLGDPDRVRQILLNLVGNAVKFTGVGHVVLFVTLSRDASGDGILELRVEDTGIGIEPGHHERIFEKFVQADWATARRYGGTGLGLAISRELVRLMGGSIEMTSTPGQGSTFRVTIPCGPLAAAPAAAPRPFDGQPVTIMESQPVAAEALDSRLRALGATTRVLAAWPPEGVALANSERVFLDGEIEGVGEILRTLGDRPVIVMRKLGMGPPGGELANRTLLFKPVREAHLLSALEGREGASPALPGTAAPRPDAEAPPGGQLRVLLVEDVPENRFLVRSYLRDTPIVLECAEDGQQAVSLFPGGRFDIVLMDMQMPVMDGFEATRRLREWERQAGREPVPIVALTAHVASEERERIFGAGCTTHVAKPMSRQTLLMVLQDLTGISPEKVAPHVSTASTPTAMGRRLAELEETLGRETVEELLDLFMRQTEPRLDQLRELDRQHDLPGLSRVAHAIRGTALNLGATELATLCERIEHSSAAMDEAERHQVLEELASSAHAALDQARRWIAERPA